MRMIGTIAFELDAEAFGDYLVTRGIANHIERGNAGWLVWVEHDDQLEAGKGELETFLRNPADGRYVEAGKTAKKIRSEEASKAERRRKNFTEVRTHWASVTTHPRPVTIALIVLCVVVYIASAGGSGEREGALNLLRIAPLVYGPYGITGAHDLRYVFEHHQYWRLITPVFLHFGIMHLVFNMAMLLSLGTMIEQRRGSWVLLAMVVASAVPSNVAQYWFSLPIQRVLFGGMSGVIYALFGYCWMKSRLQPHEGIILDESTIFIGLAWLVVCHRSP